MRRKIETGSDLRDARLQLGLTSNELAEAVGLEGSRRSQQIAVSQWEQDVRPIPARVALLVECFLDGARPSSWPRKRQQSDRR